MSWQRAVAAIRSPKISLPPLIRTHQSYISFGRFFLPHLPVFEIRANKHSPWIYPNSSLLSLSFQPSLLLHRRHLLRLRSLCRAMLRCCVAAAARSSVACTGATPYGCTAAAPCAVPRPVPLLLRAPPPRRAGRPCHASLLLRAPMPRRTGRPRHAPLLLPAPLRVVRTPRRRRRRRRSAKLLRFNIFKTLVQHF